MQRLYHLILLFLLVSCISSSNNSVIIDRTLSEMNHETGEKLMEYRIRDYSIAKGIEVFQDTLNLEQCWCNMKNDTLEIQVGYTGLVGRNAVFLVKDSVFTSKLMRWSDIAEFNGSYEMYVPTRGARLTLNKTSFSAGDSLLGRFYLKSTNKLPVLFEGDFQCVIQ